MRPRRRRRGGAASRRRRRTDHVKFKFIFHAESLTVQVAADRRRVPEVRALDEERVAART